MTSLRAGTMRAFGAAVLLGAALLPAACGGQPTPTPTPDAQAAAARMTLDAAFAGPPPAAADASATPPAGAPEAAGAAETADAQRMETAVAATFTARETQTAVATRLTPAPTPTPDAAATQRAAASTATADAARMETAVAATFVARETQTAVATRLTPEPTPTPSSTPTSSKTPKLTPTPSPTVNAPATRLMLGLTAEAAMQVSGTATAQVRATATMQQIATNAAPVRATATARAEVRATRQAQATAIADGAILSRLEEIRTTPPTLYDDLSSDSGNWGLGNDEYAAVEIAESGLRIRILRPNSEGLFAANNIMAGDLLFESDVTLRQGGSDAFTGLVIRETDHSIPFYFAIYGDGRYLVTRIHDAGWASMDSISSDAIAAGSRISRRLSVLAEGTRITLFVDGQVLAQIDSATTEAGRVGFVVSNTDTGVAEAFFDNVSVWVLD